MKSELLRHVHVTLTANVRMIISLNNTWYTELKMPNMTLYQTRSLRLLNNTHSQIVALRSKQIITNQVHEPNWILFITCGCMKWKKSNAVANESSFGHNVFSKTQIFSWFPVLISLCLWNPPSICDLINFRAPFIDNTRSQ